MSFAATTSARAPWPARGLRTGAGCVLAALLVWAPLNFGSTRAGGPEILAAGCGLATLLWALSLALGGPSPQIPVVVAASVAIIVVAALPWVLGLLTPTPVAPFTQGHFARIVARWPYSIVWRTPANLPALTVGFAAALLPLIDLARAPRWALAFSVALVATGVLVAALAFAQNYTGATGIYWRDDGRMPGNFCATFFHHTSAGAYFNTVWPPAFALTLLAAARAPAARARFLLSGAGGLATVLLLAAHTSHVSRFPQVAALLVLPFLLWRLDWRRGSRWLGLTAAVGFAAGLVVLAGRTEVILQRWSLMLTPAPATHRSTPVPEAQWPARMRADLFVADGAGGRGLGFGNRGEGWRTALRSIADRPLTGHGPANWLGAASAHSRDPFVRTFFQFLQFTHQDFLQTAVEWGLPAALAWATLLVGAVLAVLRTPRARGSVLGLGAACALAAVLLQSLGDFPLQIPAVALNVIVLAALAWSSASVGGALRPAVASSWPIQSGRKAPPTSEPTDISPFSTTPARA